MALKDWEIIRKVRTDISQYLLHTTKSRWDAMSSRLIPPFEVLQTILFCGYLKPTFAIAPQSNKATVRGPFPAVCLTEQPLQFFIRSAEASLTTERYTKFGVAF